VPGRAPPVGISRPRPGSLSLVRRPGSLGSAAEVQVRQQASCFSHPELGQGCGPQPSGITERTAWNGIHNTPCYRHLFTSKPPRPRRPLLTSRSMTGPGVRSQVASHRSRSRMPCVQSCRQPGATSAVRPLPRLLLCRSDQPLAQPATRAASVVPSAPWARPDRLPLSDRPGHHVFFVLGLTVTGRDQPVLRRARSTYFLNLGNRGIVRQARTVTDLAVPVGVPSMTRPGFPPYDRRVIGTPPCSW